MISGVLQGTLFKFEEGGAPLAQASWPSNSRCDQDMTAAVSEVSTKRRTCLKLGSDKTLVLARPIELNKTLWGVSVLRLTSRDRMGVSAATRLLQWGEAWLQYVLYQPGNSVTTSEPAYALLQKVACEGSFAEAAITVVNQLAAQFKAQQVSLGLVRGQRVRLQAVSHSATFDPRQPALQFVIAAMEEAVFAKQPLFVSRSPASPNADSLPAHAELLESNATEAVQSLPLQVAGETIAVLQLIGPCDAQGRVAVEKSLEPILPVLAQTLALKLAEDQGLSRQIAKNLLARIKTWLGPGHLLAKAAVVAGLVALGGLFVPAQFRISAEALLQGTQKHVVVVSQDGYLASVEVLPGDRVQKGQVIATLNDDDLRLQKQKLQSELQQHRHAYNNALANSDRAQAAIADAQVSQARIQLDLIEKQLERTLLRAPAEGIVVSEDISQSVGAPVKQGELLFEVASADQYRVMLYIDERDIGHVSEQQAGELVLTGLPGEVFAFRVLRITPLSEIRDGSNHFRVEAQLERQTQALRWGMTGTGRVNAGHHRYGWILLHDVFDWLRLKFWW